MTNSRRRGRPSGLEKIWRPAASGGSADKERFAAIADALAAASQCEEDPTADHFAFYQGKTVLALLTVRGSEALLYTALAPEAAQVL